MEIMEEAMNHVRALPAVVEGDRGIYELETTPVAPLLRRDDGNTMKQYVYAPTVTNSTVNRAGGGDTVIDVPQNASGDAAQTVVNPFVTDETQNVDTSQPASTNLIETGDKSYIEIARRAVTACVNEEKVRGPAQNGSNAPRSVPVVGWEIQGTAYYRRCLADRTTFSHYYSSRMECCVVNFSIIALL